ncbi:3-oxoacyl-ACP reductase [Pseudonocardia sp. EC080610-09]|uniref:3-oxoacyl-ACP reductase FabG n=1 Tax=unclassified Pseudonocardia TaxID=2619320 RepID=UPI0006CB2304|nr:MULTISPECIES: 3-oxoacyl-ACP reductase FabG [unclassified Pseudonocardia]ALE73508.1 3-oxoacyl-ACP reductase [Pseudonocardia sp. EC080625-04]ALL76967.1 3-oxoacyl-ACP reductase [Pseudonocardia sp. EC080610-09]ALL83998.1 3-oxoacyl-ACP reductase [Pseudonocardia sp. EC080619-01]
MTELEGRVALVTGAARGIGRACAQALYDQGAAVALLDLDPGVVDTATAVDPTGRRAIGLTADVVDLAGVRSAVEQTRAHLGEVGILVNNAGFPKDAVLSKMDPADWQRVIDVILTGSFNCSKAVIDPMRTAGWGRIVNISSRSHLGNPGQTNYSAAKAGLLGFTRALALESGRFGITVNAVAPGFVETEGMLALDNYDVLKERSVDKAPLRRVGTPAEIADTVAFLAGPRASYITGETVHVTGGRYS